MKKQNMTRNDQEKAEDLPVIENDAPKARFQNEQQVQNTITGAKTESADSTFAKKKVSHPGQVVKQDVVSHVISGASGGEVNAEGFATLSMSYGGNTGTIAGSAAYTPSATKVRSDSRYGKRLDDTIKKLNFVPSEQVVVERDEAKPIAESHDVQGYNGTYRNLAARAQKNNGGVPAATMFQRSVDELKRDQLYYTHGQTVKKQGVNYNDVPVVTAKRNEVGVWETPDPSEPNYQIKRGNFLPRSLKVKFKNGHISSFAFDVEDLSVETAQDDIANDASTAELRHINSAEIDRQIMDEKAGDEKADLWTPLPRAVRQPSQTVAFLKDLEGDVGSEVFMAYKKTALALSYQLNRTAKDGLKATEPMTEALIGLIVNPHKSEELLSGAKTISPFPADKRWNKLGASTIMIEAFDSVAKYDSKGALLTLPKGFKSFMQIADNNMNPLRVPEDFVKVVNNREVFSTIDRPYDPLLPVCISDREALIHPYDWNQLYSFTQDDAGVRTFAQDPFRYQYHDLRNVYVVTVAHPLLAGIANYLNDYAMAFTNALGGESGIETDELVIPIQHSTCYFSTWSLLVLAATPYIVRERVNSMRDVLYYEKNINYPFSGLVRIGDANPMNAVNYTNSDYQSPIQVGQMMPSAALSWVYPEVFWPFDEVTSISSGDPFKMLAPWYFSENDFEYSEQSVSGAVGAHNITMPSIRTGIRLGPADMIYSMSERDVRLCLDRLVALPPPKSEDEEDKGVYKYDQQSDGIPFFTWDKETFSISTFLSLPRELGYFMVAPANLLTPKYNKNFASEDSYKPVFAAKDDAFDGSSSYTAKVWFGYGGTALGDNGKENILKPEDINVDRSTAYVQRWMIYDCIRTEDAVTQNLGFQLSVGELFSGDAQAKDGEGLFRPFTTGVHDTTGSEKQQTKDDETFKVLSFQKGLWTRVQILPFALSPFDFAANLKGTALKEDGVKYDPFDMLYVFGCCGFRASDYTEDVYNHDNMITNQGLTFLKDPWFEDSPIVKESVKLTQV